MAVYIYRKNSADAFSGEMGAAKYSLAELQSILRQAGWSESLIPIMAAIGMAESSGNPSAINPGFGAGGRRTNEYSVGLWQINTKVHKNFTVEQLKNPLTNAKEALRIYKMQGLRAWGAYTDGRYKKHFAASQTAYKNPGNVNLPGDNQSPKPDDDEGFTWTPAAAVAVAAFFILVLID